MAEITIHLRDNTTGGVGSVVFSRQSAGDRAITPAQRIGIACVQKISEMLDEAKQAKKKKRK